MQNKLSPQDKAVVVGTLASFLVSFLVLRLSDFSASTMVNSQNYIVKTMILSTTGMTTLAAIYTALKPFTYVFISLIFFVLAISILSFYGYKNNNKRVGILAGLLSAACAVIIFETLWGAFLAIAVFLCSYYSPQFSNTYSKELKRWIFFRTGSNTAGKVMFMANIVISLGLFLAVLQSQAAYEVTFRNDLTDSMRSIVMSTPGASLLSQATLDQKIDTAISSSTLFQSYIRWLPVMTAFGAWVVLEFLRNVILANLSGVFTFILLKKSENK
ncbi:MAG TPA: hypothetical protein VJB05_02725 [archaeon]|nr:hypothetical protein [archaeon]